MDAFIFKNFQELEFGRYYRMDPLSNLSEMFEQANMKKQVTTAKLDIRKGRKIEQEITNTYEQRGSKPVQDYVGTGRSPSSKAMVVFGRSPNDSPYGESFERSSKSNYVGTPKQRFQFKRIEYKKR